MKITIDIDRLGLTYQEFHTKEQWTDFMYQFRPNRGFYNPQPQDTSPQRFPCAMLADENRIRYCADRNDEYWNIFLYAEDYTEVYED